MVCKIVVVCKPESQQAGVTTIPAFVKYGASGLHSVPDCGFVDCCDSGVEGCGPPSTWAPGCPFTSLPISVRALRVNMDRSSIISCKYIAACSHHAFISLSLSLATYAGLSATPNSGVTTIHNSAVTGCRQPPIPESRQSTIPELSSRVVDNPQFRKP